MALMQVGSYRLDTLLGSGGMGEVYKAHDTQRDRYVDGRLFIDMRLVDGTDICSLIRANGPVEPQRAAYFVGQIAEALDAAHADHLVHRDIKPSNILVTASDFVYVIDFGITRAMGSPRASWPQPSEVAPNGKFAYITDTGAKAITVLDTVTDQVSKTIPIPEGPPQFVSFSNDGRTAYVSVYTTSGSVHLIAFIDTATGKVTGTEPVTNHTPGPSEISPNGRYLYVPNHNSMTMSGAMTAMSGPGSRSSIRTLTTSSKSSWWARPRTP